MINNFSDDFIAFVKNKWPDVYVDFYTNIHLVLDGKDVKQEEIKSVWLLTFKNGFVASIIYGPGSFSTSGKKYNPFRSLKNKNLADHAYDAEVAGWWLDQSDFVEEDVQGYLTPVETIEWISQYVD